MFRDHWVNNLIKKNPKPSKSSSRVQKTLKKPPQNKWFKALLQTIGSIHNHLVLGF